VTLDEKTVECALALQTDWFLWRNSENDQTLEAENRAIVKVMHDWSRLGGLMGGGLVVDGKMIAYTIAEALDDTSIVIHFEKGCPNFKGVYQAINQIFWSAAVRASRSSTGSRIWAMRGCARPSSVTIRWRF
jgi:uncharacterized protein